MKMRFVRVRLRECEIITYSVVLLCAACINALSCVNRTTDNGDTRIRQHVLKTARDDAVELTCLRALQESPPNYQWFVPGFKNRSHWDATDIEYTEQFNETQWLAKVTLLSNSATLLVQRFQMEDSGFYSCRYNTTGEETGENDTVHGEDFYLFCNKDKIYYFEILSIIIGLLAAACGAFIGVIIGFIKTYLVYTCTPCRSARENAAATSTQLCQYLVEFEQNRLHNLRQIRENYAAQKNRIYQSYQQQVSRISENYQARRERFRDYRVETIGCMRDQYSQQVTRIGGYSAGQLARIHRNYTAQVGRMRHFSYQQLERTRHQYKLKQKHVKKIFDQLPWPEVCRSMSVVGSTDTTRRTADGGKTDDMMHANGVQLRKKKASKTTPDMMGDRADYAEPLHQFWLPVDFEADISMDLGEFDSLAPPSSLELSGLKASTSNLRKGDGFVVCRDFAKTGLCSSNSNHNMMPNSFRPLNGVRGLSGSSFYTQSNHLAPKMPRMFVNPPAGGQQYFRYPASRSRSRTRPGTYCARNEAPSNHNSLIAAAAFSGGEQKDPVNVNARRFSQVTVVDIESPVNREARVTYSSHAESSTSFRCTTPSDYMTPTSSLTNISTRQQTVASAGGRKSSSVSRSEQLITKL